jgi:Zinc finger, C2H2 type
LSCAVSDDGLFSTMPEPLNLISRPLDLTIGVRMGDEDDDDPESVYGMLMTAGMASAAAADGSVPSSADQRLACICGKTFDAAEPFASHIASCAKSKMTPYKTCETCGKVLFSNSGYMKHRRLHAGAYKYRCGVCRQGFFDQTNLRAHADSRHSKVRRYSCPRCDKSFYWKHHVKRHMESCGTAVVGPDVGDADVPPADVPPPGVVDGSAGAQKMTIDATPT